jgi:hypothetical protein
MDLSGSIVRCLVLLRSSEAGGSAQSLAQPNPDLIPLLALSLSPPSQEGPEEGPEARGADPLPRRVRRPYWFLLARVYAGLVARLVVVVRRLSLSLLSGTLALLGAMGEHSLP